MNLDAMKSTSFQDQGIAVFSSSFVAANVLQLRLYCL